jgi:hypothetical protein
MAFKLNIQVTGFVFQHLSNVLSLASLKHSPNLSTTSGSIGDQLFQKTTPNS